MAVVRVTAQGGGMRRGTSGAVASAGGRLLIALCAISLVLLTLSAREAGTGPISSVRAAFTVVTKPVRELGTVITSPIYGLRNVAANLTADQQTLSELKAENERLSARNAELEEANKNATRLEALLGLQNTYSLQSTGARIIASSTDSWTRSVTIDKGSTHGLAVGMPVCDANGVIGQISECGVSSSVVRLINDENSSISAMVQTSRAQGMLRGSADGSLRLTLVRTDSAVEPGDLVITSGLGGAYPKGLPLGVVTNVERPSGALYYEIDVRSFTVADSYEEILVITSLTEDQKATAEDVAAVDMQEAQQATSSSDDDDDQADEQHDETSADTESQDESGEA